MPVAKDFLASKVTYAGIGGILTAAVLAYSEKLDWRYATAMGFYALLKIFERDANVKSSEKVETAVDRLTAATVRNGEAPLSSGEEPCPPQELPYKPDWGSDKWGQ